jgi:hypothetical protein
VLSLFAVAILSERAFYDRQMCVCDTCGRVSFDAQPGFRRSCNAHAPRASTTSFKPPTRGLTPQGTGVAAPPSARKTGGGGGTGTT